MGTTITPLHTTLIPLARALGKSRFLHEYLSGEGTARSYFPHPPDVGAVAAVAEVVDREAGRAPRAAVSAALVAFQEHLGVPPAAVENARRLADPQAVAVVTGQQPGVLTGPLFTIYKAISIVNLARRIGRETGRPAVPVFWVGSEDADRIEVDHAFVMDRESAPARIALELGDEWTGRPVGAFPVDIESVTQALDEALPDSEFKPALLDWLRAGEGAQWRNLGQWFASLLARLFGVEGLVVLDPCQQPVKELLRPVFRRAIEETEWPGAGVRAAFDRLKADGYHPTLRPREDHTGFSLADGAREPVLVEGDRFRAGEQVFTREDLLRLLDDHPDRFLTTASLRVLAQDTLLPTVLYAAGPHELLYLAQLREAYEAAGLTMPVVLPRASATLVEGWQARLLDDLGASVFDLHDADERGVMALSARASAGGVVEVFEEARRVVGESAGRVAAASAETDQTLATPAAKLREKFDQELRRLEERVLAARARQDEGTLRRLQHTQAALIPLGELQERVLCLVSFLARHPGPWHGAGGLVPRLTAALDGTEGQHAVVRLG